VGGRLLEEGLTVSLSKMESKREKRVKKRKYHYRRWSHLKQNNRKVRAAWHRRRYRQERKAVKKWDRLIRKEKKSRKINWSGKAPLSHPPLLKTVRVGLEVPGLYITSTTGGTHSATSWHYKARAWDGGSSDPSETPEKKAQQKLLDTFGPGYFAELFGPLNWHVKDGQLRSGTFPGHHDHLHVAVA
jgi:hypothetical protein